MNSFAQIYKITNKINNKSYIGKSKDYIKRFEKHKKLAKKFVNRVLYDAINKYGIENFDLILIEEIFINDQNYINTREIFWIERENTLYPNGYNMTTGGDGGYTLANWDEEAKLNLYKRQAEKRTGFRHSTETKTLISLKHKENWNKVSLTDKAIHNKKISIKYKELGISPPEYTKFKTGCKGLFKGRKHSEESKSKMSLARKGKTYSEIMGDLKAMKLKVDKSKSFSGNKNPNYVEFGREVEIKLLEYIILNKVKMSLLSEHIGKSLYKIRQWMRGYGIMNYQKLYNNLDDSEWKLFWENIYDKNVARDC